MNTNVCSRQKKGILPYVKPQITVVLIAIESGITIGSNKTYNTPYIEDWSQEDKSKPLDL